MRMTSTIETSVGGSTLVALQIVGLTRFVPSVMVTLTTLATEDKTVAAAGVIKSSVKS